MQSGLLIDEDYESELQRNGVIKIPFLQPAELEAIKNFYVSLHGNNDPPAMYDGISMTIWCADLDYKLKVKNTLRELMVPACERLFKNYRAVSQQFIVKRCGKETTFPVHQDWSVIDEFKYSSFNIWIPLQDVDANNGSMWIIKGSHRVNRKIRGAGYLFPDYISIHDKLKPYMSNYPMKAGEALLFYHNTIHGSPPNTTNETRIVMQISVIPKEAPFHIYFQKGPGTPLEVHHPVDDFTYYYNRLREDSEVKPPTEKAEEIKSSFVNEPPSLVEVIRAVHNTQP